MPRSRRRASGNAQSQIQKHQITGSEQRTGTPIKQFRITRAEDPEPCTEAGGGDTAAERHAGGASEATSPAVFSPPPGAGPTGRSARPLPPLPDGPALRPAPRRPSLPRGSEVSPGPVRQFLKGKKTARRCRRLASRVSRVNLGDTVAWGPAPGPANGRLAARRQRSGACHWAAVLPLGLPLFTALPPSIVR
jgi:hypothetical protein